MIDIGIRTGTWWVSYRDGNPLVRVLCLPYAGAGAAAYCRWQLSLPDDVVVVGARLPGRESRLAERYMSDMDALVEALARAAAPLLDRPFILFGHSMGALLAYELAHRLRVAYQTEPTFLVVSGHSPPHRATPTLVSALSDDALVSALRCLGGTPPEILANPEFLALLLPVLRADLRLCESYVYRRRPKLTRPVYAFVGQDDTLVEKSAVLAWGEHTSGAFRLQEFSGGHFYFREAPGDLLASIGELCRRALAECIYE